MLLEDLGHLRVGRTQVGSTREEAELVIRELARLHAAWWDRPELAEYPWLLHLDAPGFQPAGQHFAECCKRLWRFLGDSLPPAVLPVIDRLDILPLLHRQLSRPPLTLIHHDPQMDNLFFDGSNGGLEVVASDWQPVGATRGPIDVAYFLSSSVPVPERRANEGRWLADYYRLLSDGGVRDYSFEQCLYDYRLALLAALGRMIQVVGAPQVTNDAHVHDWLPWMLRLCTAIVDNDSGGLLRG